MKNIFHIGLISKKPGILESFYKQLLGNKSSFRDSDNYLEFDLKAVAVLDIESEILLKQDLPDCKSGKFYLRFQVDNIDKIYAQCRKNKVKILKGPITQPYMKRELYLVDPDNNLVQLFQEIYD